MASREAAVVIIGAGQAGLSVAHYLQKLGMRPGIEMLILDRGPKAGGAWQHRWESLRLGSAHRVHDLPGMRPLGISFETADRSAPAGEVVGEYYARYEAFYGLNVQRPVSVLAVHDRGADLVLSTTGGEVTTQAIVNATGTWGAPFVPYYPGIRDFGGRQLHTSTYVSAEEFRGRRVLVVGGGTSAIGFLLELEGIAAETFWAARRPIDYLDHGALHLEDAVQAVDSQDKAARSGRALPSIVSGTGVPKTRRIAAGIERGVLDARSMFTRFDETGVVWADGTHSDIDAVIWATGFRPDIRHLSPLRLHEKQGGVTVSTGAAEKDPRIFFAGYGPTASTVGANRAGRTIARQVYALVGEWQPPAEQGTDIPKLAASVQAPPEPAPGTDAVSILSRFFD